MYGGTVYIFKGELVSLYGIFSVLDECKVLLDVVTWSYIHGDVQIRRFHVLINEALDVWLTD